MNNYKEIIELNKFFKPYYDLTAEENDFWKSFIPNQQFYKSLSKALASIESTNPKDRLSLWMQGTYGTGKSFATAVIKNLLFNNLDNIDEFLEKIENPQLKLRLKKFRKNNRVFPVVLKGTGEIRDNSTFSYEIEKAVKNALDKAEIIIKTQTDFDRMIMVIENNELHSDWDRIIKNNIELNMYVSNKEELISKLKNYDKTLLLKFEEILSKTHIHFSHTKIEEWLSQVLIELKNRNIANNIIIYWDEFTSILEMPNSNLLLSKLQDIAELSSYNNIFLFMVSHRTPEQAKLSTEDMKKVLGRFSSFEYEMETITNYHLIGSAIKKTNKNKWFEYKERSADKLRKTINLITETEGSKISDMIKNLFPIHPYTAYLSTFVSRYIGSSERSIFKFLNDDKKGFLHFINNNPNNDGEYLLTSEYLFDFFYDDFKNSNKQNILAVINRFNLYKTKVEKEDLKYSKIFKAILLLNILYRFVENVGYVKPNEENLNLIFSATSVVDELTEALAFLQNNQIIGKNPDGLYLIESSSLPIDEVTKSQESLRLNYKSVLKVLNQEQKSEIKDKLTSGIFRIFKFELFDIPDNTHILKNRLKKIYKDTYFINIAFFIPTDYSELENIKKIIEEVLQDDSFKNIIFIIPADIFDNDSFLKFIQHQARAHVAGKHNLKEELDLNLDYAKKVVDQWLYRFLTASINWYVRYENNEIKRNNDKILMTDFADVVNKNIMNKIFSQGINTLRSSLQNKNIWDWKTSKAVLESYLFTETLDELEEKTKNSLLKQTREILKDNNRNYIVKQDNLNFIKGINQEHPLKIMNTKLRNTITSKKGEVFNLAKTLSFLTKPPFGIYPNMIHFATIAFLMRNYVGKLYEAGTGRPLEKEIMRDKIVFLFENWSGKSNSSKLEVRLGTKEEKLLIDEFCNIFSFEKKESLNDVKWSIRKWIKEKPSYPLWSFSYKEGLSEIIKDALFYISEFLDSLDTSFSHEEVKETLEVISAVNLDLKNLFSNHEIAEELFIRRLREIENIMLSEEEEPKLLDFIRRRMPEEIGVDAWKEDKVISLAKDWNNQKLRELIEKSRHSLSPNTNPNDNNQKITEIEKHSYDKKVDDFKGDLKLILKRIGQEHPELIRIIEQYIN